MGPKLDCARWFVRTIVQQVYGGDGTVGVAAEHVQTQRALSPAHQRDIRLQVGGDCPGDDSRGARNEGHIQQVGQSHG